MTSKEFVAKLIEIAKSDTTYIWGGYGQYMTTANKILFKTMYPSKNNNPKEYPSILDGINKATKTTRGFDCNGLCKGTINGDKGYTKSPCPDVGIKDMLSFCTDVSEDMSNIEIGEYLAYANYGHCGVYAGVIDGKRMAIECTFNWDNGVQLIDIDRPERATFNAKGNYWKYHGKLTKFITYEDKTITELKNYADGLVNAYKGQQNPYILTLQKRLNAMGYSRVSAVGYFGDDTENAVKDVQKKNGLNVTGIIDLDTLNTMLKEN